MNQQSNTCKQTRETLTDTGTALEVVSQCVVALPPSASVAATYACYHIHACHVFQASEGKSLFHRIGRKGRIWQL